MELASYVDGLRTDLLRAVEAASPETRALAERLSGALDPAVRMALLEALSHAAAEITQDLQNQAVEVRLKGREPQFVVSMTQPLDEGPIEPDVDATEAEDDSEVVARITVRISESLKSRAEESAADLGQSLNSWIVAAIRRATRDRSFNIDLELGSLPFPPGAPAPPTPPGHGRNSRRIQGWAR